MAQDTLEKVQRELIAWQQHNFPNRDAWEPLVGMQEELGELAHAFLKRHQRIRPQDYDAAIRDAIADLLVYTCDFANSQGIDVAAELNRVWSEVVAKRDWAKHRQDEGLV